MPATTHSPSLDLSLATNEPTLQVVATALFACAVLHTFLVSPFARLAQKYPVGSIGENFFHFLSEVEVVMGLWAGLLIAAIIGFAGIDTSIQHLESLDFTEPAFVFVIMCMAATRPIIKLAATLLWLIAKNLPLPSKISFYLTTLIFGPLFGSFITEPAAITLTALILLDGYFNEGMSARFKYATIGLLFVNISIGGTLTHFAAPPVLMVASTWDWGILHMVTHYGYKAAIAIVICTSIISFAFKKELAGELQLDTEGTAPMPVPPWIIAIHCIFLFLVVYTAHHMVFFLGLFLFFLGFTKVTEEYQDRIKLRESLLVGFFLGGLVVLGSMQKWWLQPILSQLDSMTLYLAATGLTAITDNAALTYLGSLVDGLSDTSKYYLVAGAVTGGGLTLIANAPNPAGYGILKPAFGETGLNPLLLFFAAIPPTIVALLCFRFLPHF